MTHEDEHLVELFAMDPESLKEEEKERAKAIVKNDRVAGEMLRFYQSFYHTLGEISDSPEPPEKVELPDDYIRHRKKDSPN